KRFVSFVKNLEKKKPVVVCGDFNVAHKPIDLANPKSNYNKTAGYTQAEIDGFQNLVDNGLVDTFREFDKNSGKYTYWGMWNNLRERNVGWRIDYFLVSRRFMKNVKNSFILSKIMGSDHCPVGLEVEVK
ncbi:exodeoxyribonuclease III, partial [Candidatus Pacearchaeota archaeon CG10_big_fil_rev_8_21_14_0_10_34_12]